MLPIRRIASDPRELDVLRSKVWLRMVVSNQAVYLAQTAMDQISAIRQAIAAELTRRWPGATIAPPAS